MYPHTRHPYALMGYTLRRPCPHLVYIEPTDDPLWSTRLPSFFEYTLLYVFLLCCSVTTGILPETDEAGMKPLERELMLVQGPNMNEPVASQCHCGSWLVHRMTEKCNSLCNLHTKDHQIIISYVTTAYRCIESRWPTLMLRRSLKVIGNRLLSNF
jgi:hypothetical protein